MPCQPRPAASRERLLHHRGGVDEDLDVAAGILDQPAAELLEPRLDHLVIVVALGIDRDGAAQPLFQDRQRIVVRTIIDAEHDDRTHVGPHRARIAAPVRRSLASQSMSPCAPAAMNSLQPLRRLRMASGRVTPTTSKPCARAASISAALSAAAVRNRDWRSSATAAGRAPSRRAACGTTGAI